MEAQKSDGTSSKSMRVKFSLNPFEEGKVKTITAKVKTKGSSGGESPKTVTQMADDDDANDSTPAKKYTLRVKFSLDPFKKRQALEDYDSYFMFRPEEVSPGYTAADDDDGIFINLLTPDPGLELYHSSYLEASFTILSPYRPVGVFDFAQVCFDADWAGEVEANIEVEYESGHTYTDQGTFLVPEPASATIMTLGGLLFALKRRKR
jgi:hypothetical protein